MDDEARELVSRETDRRGEQPAAPAEPPAAGQAPPSADALSRLLRLATPRPPVPAERAARVEAVVRAHWSERVRARRRRAVLLAAAALLVVAVGVMTWWRLTAPEPAPEVLVARVERVVGAARLEGDFEGFRPVVEGEQLATGTTLVTGDDGRTALQWGDRASLRLDRATRVRLVEPNRVELLAGALYVDSPSGAGDLRVTTRWGEVREIGTQFEVRANDEVLRVRVREGLVELRPGGRTYEAASGVELSLAADGRLSRRSITTHDRDWEWVTSIAPSFELDGRSLGEFLAWVSRETGREVRYSDPELAATAPEVVLGGAVVDLSPAQALLAVLPTCDLEHRVENGWYVLSRSRS